MEELINEFIAETREMLEALGGEIVAWEAAPGERARLDEIFRFVHTVKGNCGFFDLPRLETLSHAAEDALAEVRSGRRAADERLVSGVLAIIDRIGELVQALETGEAIASADDRMLIEALREQAGPREAAPEAGASSFEARKAIRSIRLPVDLLDRMMSGVSDMVLARNELARRLREAPADAALEAAFERVSACIGEMRESITRTRMQRIDNLFVTLPRMVRDLGAELGKQVHLEIEGGDVELDREMIEMIRDPLTHIVRNAIDHGIEPVDERLKQGKAAMGHLRICARQSGNQILLEIGDDGRGIDGEKLLRKAISAGLYSGKQAERLTPAQRTALIFEAGLSTAQEVTAISGRGVGMDVVRANIERIGGLVDVESRVGQGVKLTLRVPLTLTIIPALTVSAGGQVYAIPRSAIEEIVRARSDAVRVERLGGSLIVSIRERRIPLVMLSTLLGSDELPDTAESRIVVLKPAGGDLYAVGVDWVHDHEELVIKPASPLVMAAGLYAGTTLADDGSPVLLLDPSGMASTAGILLDQKDAGARVAEATPAPAREETPALLFRTLDGVKRVISLSVVQRIEEVPAEAIRFSAGRVRVAIGDEILTLAGCGATPPSRPIRILRLSDGRSELAYAFADGADMVSIGGDIKPAAVSGEVYGVTLIGEEQVEMLDPFWLFAAHGCEPSAGEAVPVCAIPADDPWMRNILRPIVESAGYKVVDAGAGDEFDVLIAAADAPLDPSAAAEAIRLRASAEAPRDDGSIYRYDRAALLSALGERASRARKG